jgi:hypothetical protein
MPDAFSYVRRAGRRVVIRHRRRLAATLGAALLLTPAAAHGATRAATSASTGMTATLEGAQLTVSPGPSVSSTFLRSVQGRPVTVACVSGAGDLVELVEGESLVPSGAFDFSFLGGPALWTARATTLAYTLPRDVSERADGCVVGRDLNMAAAFGFNVLARSALDETLGVQRLALAHGAAKVVARERGDRRFPSPRSLARAIAKAEPQMDVGFSRTVRRARRNDVVYVIGARSNFKRVQLSYRQNDGQPILLDGRRRGEPDIEEPESAFSVPGIQGDERRRGAGR